MLHHAFLLILYGFLDVKALKNGLALTPPMGWCSWAKFMCQTDCVTFPTTCISQQLYMDMADHMAADGYLDVGYHFINIDDCWMANNRDSNGQLVANSTRFPDGIKSLAAYMHDRGLKLGIYEDYGNLTCGGYPGSYGYLETDANTFASWDVDMLKFDGCYIDAHMMSQGYPQMAYYLNKTGRPIVYSTEWPLYDKNAAILVNMTQVSETCNLFRDYNDISLVGAWNSIMTIIHYFDSNQDYMIPVNYPGSWNDPDMILVGNNMLTVDQSKAQMAIWSIWSAPLLMSNDLRSISDEYKEILLNRQVIAVNQDPLGVMGRLTINTTHVGIYVKAMTPYDSVNDEYSYAIVFLNRDRRSSISASVTQIAKLGLTNPNGYQVLDLFSGEDYGILLPTDSFYCSINSTGVVMIKATVIADNLTSKPKRVFF